MKIINIILKALVWIILIILPLALVVVSFLTAAEENVSDSVVLSAILFFINPLYVTAVSYYFINTKSAVFMYLGVVFPWLLLCMPYLARTNDDWLAIAKAELSMGVYQIIGITVFFTIACLVKYLVYRRKAKKEIEKAPVSEEDGTETNFDC